MTEIRCEIFMSSNDEVVMVELRTPRNTSGEALRVLAEAIAAAFASADQENPLDRIVETRGPSYRGPWVIIAINRRYQDAEFPRRLAAALRAIGLTDFQPTGLH